MVSYSKEFETEIEISQQVKVERYTKYIYNKIKFSKVNKLSYEAFKYGFYGYLNMVEAGKINPNSLLTICDYTLSSNVKRMWVIDIHNKKVLFNTLVAHGMGTGEEFAIAFSNTEDSHQSSLGFYTTGETYEGNNGYSLKLHGVDGSFNSNAFDRAIVIHGAEYVCDEFAKCNNRIGRSHGCPALPVDIAPKVIDKIKDGTCFFIYHTAQKYIASSYWLRTKIKQLPQEADEIDLLTNSYGNSQGTLSNEADAISETACITKNTTKPEIEAPISDFNKRNYTNKVQTIIISKGKDTPKEASPIISSVVIIHESSKNTPADTVIVK